MRSRKAWVVSLCVSAVIGLFLLTITSESFEKCEHDRKNHHAYEALHKEGPLLIKAIVRLGLHAVCARQTASENDGAITALSGIAVALFTLALWVSTEKLWKVATDQSVDAKRSVEVAERTLYANERAWLSIELDEWGDIEFYKDNRASIIVTFLVKNFGKTPALNVHTSIELSSDPNHIQSARDFSGTCKSLIQKAGRLLMPEQSYKRKWLALCNGSYPEHNQAGVNLFPIIIACVTYQTLPDLSVHQTFVCYLISKTLHTEDGTYLALKVGERLPKEDLTMTVTSGGRAD